MKGTIRRAVLAGTLPALLMLVPSAAPAVSVAVGAGVVAAPAPAYVGCFAYVSGPGSSCIAAHRVAGGIDLVLVNNPNEKIVAANATIERATVPGTLELFFEPGRPLPSIRLVATLPRAGLVDLRSRGTFWVDGYAVTGLLHDGVELVALHDVEHTDLGNHNGIASDTVSSGSVGGRAILARTGLVYSRFRSLLVWSFALI